MSIRYIAARIEEFLNPSPPKHRRAALRRSVASIKARMERENTPAATPEPKIVEVPEPMGRWIVDFEWCRAVWLDEQPIADVIPLGTFRGHSLAQLRRQAAA